MSSRVAVLQIHKISLIEIKISLLTQWCLACASHYVPCSFLLSAPTVWLMLSLNWTTLILKRVHFMFCL